MTIDEAQKHADAMRAAARAVGTAEARDRVVRAVEIERAARADRPHRVPLWRFALDMREAARDVAARVCDHCDALLGSAHASKRYCSKRCIRQAHCCRTLPERAAAAAKRAQRRDWAAALHASALDVRRALRERRVE